MKQWEEDEVNDAYTVSFKNTPPYSAEMCPGFTGFYSVFDTHGLRCLRFHSHQRNWTTKTIAEAIAAKWNARDHD